MPLIIMTLYTMIDVCLSVGSEPGGVSYLCEVTLGFDYKEFLS